MGISIFDLFSIGLGPSSSHTVGPMRAAKQFLIYLQKIGVFQSVERVETKLYGSLALTGKGHATDIAILLGLEGETPDGVDPESVQARALRIRSTHKLNLDSQKLIGWHESSDLLFLKDEFLPYHPNAVRFTAFDAKGQQIATRVLYSVGGGFVVDESSTSSDSDQIPETTNCSFPYQFETCSDLLLIAKREKISIAEIIMRNELSLRTKEEIYSKVHAIWSIMKQSIERGTHTDGILPGGLKVRRRAKGIYESLNQTGRVPKISDMMEWVSLWALAVNEENAAGSRIVTAPTNGSAGVIPAVIKYFETFSPHCSEDAIVTFFLVAGAMGILYKKGASISAAEMGCMGEIGVACSMAAAGLTAVEGGTNEQIENAAEIGMEHHLGLTCDPIAGLVQIPCIERNTMGALKAINASLLALQGDGQHKVSLDQVIATMKETGHNMHSIYKETSLGGLAVNVPEC